MTLIQPNKHSRLLNVLLIFLSVAVTGAVICLIFLYNQTVSFSRGAVSLNEETSQILAENSELKSATFALLDPYHLSNLAASQGLAPGASPRYVKIPTWVAVSHF
jgi:hypothetical protein